MAGRKTISQKTRFEVFKRDTFKCQYCGRSAPEVILHVDHINPVARGGKNELVNYLTACSECNQGKGARKLDDSAELTKQKLALDELNEKRNQLKMMVEWRNELADMSNMEVSVFDDALGRLFGKKLTEHGKRDVTATIKKYGLTSTLDALDQAHSHPMPGKEIVDMVDAICHFTKQNQEKPYLKDLYYIRGILRNRIEDYEIVKYKAIGIMESMLESGVSADDMKLSASNAESWIDFVGGLM